MAEISRAALFGKLDSLAYQAIDSATVFCRMRGNPYVELAHWLNQILQLQDSDLHRVVGRFELDPSRLARDITRSLDSLPRGASSVSDLSSHVEDAVERAWVWASLRFGDSSVRTGHLLVGLLKSPGLRSLLPAISAEFGRIRVDQLIEEWDDILGDSPEAAQAASDGTRIGQDAAAAGGEPAEAARGGPAGRQEALQRFTIDLTEQARAGRIDPVVGRDEEIRQMIDILMRRRQNNPILTGEAGVGKTAVAEGFARRIATGDVPPPLREVSLRALDVGLLQAGASVKGEFENRLRQVIDEVQGSERPIILFIDEAHTLIGAGGAAGTGDAANLLKPALARGTLRTIGATTWTEYKKYIEKDPALSRRFQAVQVQEPDEERAAAMIRSMASALEQHHRVQLRDEALTAAVRLSSRYIPARQLPDKAVSLLDTACARVAVSQHGVPAEVEDSRRRIEALETELEIIGREQTVGMDTGDREPGLRQAVAEERERLAGLEEAWQREKSVVDRILELRAALRERAGSAAAADEAAAAGSGDAPSPAAGGDDTGVAGEESGGQQTPETTEGMVARLRELQAELEDLQGERPLILPSVDAQAVASVVADWTGIPVGRMVRDEIAAVLSLSERLSERVKGQDHALAMIARRVQTARANLDNPGKPVGVFMLAGPSGVGKTETALALAETLYGGEHNVITINMSEFQEAHTVSTLKGAPPGYVGYGEGGVLTEAVRRRPYSVVLLDEVEKAHPDVHEIFFQVFDKGWMEDGEGRLIDFKNTLIILTTNVGTELIMRACGDGQQRPDAAELTRALREPLLRVFPPALLGRIVTVPYYPLGDDMLRDIIRLQLDRIAARVQDNHEVPFSYEEAVVDQVLARCTELESGGRMIDAILTNSLLPDLSREFLGRLIDHRPIRRVHVDVTDAEFTYAFE
ncbi:type VI secretion system ATPase TssH [Sediminicurvatus halobius]|uniref:Type VI secretion system ATPase TssH n=1 Tax=Sediminicurvatus halobius TaxID=2182432 RepID=A0A2U2N247_9GAMM|nr:type VI secretion system ATPase TssH [Spiribacter halobius]PWG63266.1 type VI secretion system ATPase TssH [Spiribacter halobius]UEX76661.1 type VI secretion system ATPase TssH [Spiribacter halobius]